MRCQEKPNALLTSREMNRLCRLTDQDSLLLEHAIERLGLSARAYHRVLKAARTIADLGGAENIVTAHLTEAISYRRMDRSVTTV